ncbi:MAG: guanylate kinase [Alphaproteobacteria bacterium]
MSVLREASGDRRGVLFVVSAPSGAGKTTLVRSALERLPDLELSVSFTTRRPRVGEVDGRDYFFVEEGEFVRRLAAGEFVEWASVFDHSYATPRAPLDAAIAAGRDVLLAVDIQGARSIKTAYPRDAVGVFVVPPSLEELETRLRARGTDGEEQVRRRLDRARLELQALAEPGVYDYRVVNRLREPAAEELRSIVVAERCRNDRAR